MVFVMDIVQTYEPSRKMNCHKSLLSHLTFNKRVLLFYLSCNRGIIKNIVLHNITYFIISHNDWAIPYVQ